MQPAACVNKLPVLVLTLLLLLPLLGASDPQVPVASRQLTQEECQMADHQCAEASERYENNVKKLKKIFNRITDFLLEDPSESNWWRVCSDLGVFFPTTTTTTTTTPKPCYVSSWGEWSKTVGFDEQVRKRRITSPGDNCPSLLESRKVTGQGTEREDIPVSI